MARPRRNQSSRIPVSKKTFTSLVSIQEPRFARSWAFPSGNSWWRSGRPPVRLITTARKAKGKEEWYIGAITDENARIASASLNFLDGGKNYVATLYLDGEKAHWKDNPMEYQIQKFIVSNKTTLKLKLASGGGTAVSIKPASADEVKKLKKYRN